MRDLGARAVQFWWGQGIADDVPALTYYLLLSLAPFALGVAALEALLLKDVSAARHVADQINRYVPHAIHGDIRHLVLATRNDSTRLLVIAIAAMLWTSSGAIGVIERCESRILGSERHGIVAGRLRNMLLGAAVAAMVAAGSISAPVIGDAATALNLRGRLSDLELIAVNAFGSILLFTGVYRWAPRRTLRWRSAVQGAIPAGIAIQAIPAVVGLYVGATAGFRPVQLFLILTIVLFGLWIMAMVMLLGAGLAARGERRQPPARR
jgi:YihY family inner membrane protein